MKYLSTSPPGRSAKPFKSALLPACVWLRTWLAWVGIWAADVRTEKEIVLFLETQARTAQVSRAVSAWLKNEIPILSFGSAFPDPSDEDGRRDEPGSSPWAALS